MDHMDWFEPEGTQAPEEIRAINKAMKLGGRVLLRSAGLKPWYIAKFSEQGFACERVAARTSGTCIDRYVLELEGVLRLGWGSDERLTPRVG